ncbi:hypothetical protein NP590_19990 [Methylomonas sp. SURF-2]|uniref:TIGR03016 family PEP-CTERM system-associated outer membrane protein n=1 Tax=Methylomonas subterranea TaxID=2952225 RepID=A0ABT1TLQ0_9GAMM|nr:hypothetical protein [Methylomonas sp. SURF-2]MCQ8106395.1 hypothetical protein [Methylomonas sp. SURF-2]
MKSTTKLLLPVMALFSHNSHAFDWLFEPNFGASERYTDNLRMQINPARDNFITTLSPGILLGYIAENHTLNTTFKWNELIYHGESDLNFSEKIANLKQDYFGERFKAELSAQYAEQSTINTQLDLTDNAFNLQIQIPRTSISFSPTFTYNFDERNALQLAYNYTDVSYEKTPGLTTSRAFSDYRNQQYSGTYTHSFTERFSLNLTGAYALFSTAGDNPPGVLRIPPFRFPVESSFSQEASTFNYQAGFQYAYDERTRVSLSAGIRDTSTDSSVTQNIDFLGLPPELFGFSQQPTVSDQSFKTSGNVFSGNFNRKYDWGSIDLNGARQLSPASTAGQRNTTSFSASANYAISERWSSGIKADYLLSESIGTNNNAINNSRTMISLTPNIQWLWTPEIRLSLSYTYRQLEFGSINDTAFGNNLQLQFSYQPQINRQVK